MSNVPSLAEVLQYCEIPERARPPLTDFKRVGFALTDYMNELTRSGAPSD
jgi:hypothetical protein